MAHIDKAPEGGKFRAKAAAALDGTAGAWGDGDLLNVNLDANGELVVAGATDVVGVIWTKEGKRNPDAANFAQAVGGKVYTVLRRAELVEMEQGGAPPSAGDRLFGAAAGAAGATAVGAVFLGWVDDTGNRLILDVRGEPEG